MSREWFLALTEEFFNPKRHLFRKHAKGYFYEVDHHSQRNRRHLSEFTFVGMILGMAIYHGKLFHGHFSLPFYKALLGRSLVLADLKQVDESHYKSLQKVEASSDVSGWELTFTVMDTNEDGKAIEVELKSGGAEIEVTNENKAEFLELTVQYFERRVADQMAAIKLGLYLFVPTDFLQEFEPEEIDQLIGGVEPSIDDLRNHTTYFDPLTDSSNLVRLFWDVVSTFDEEELKRLVRFVTGTDKVPIGGFAHLVGSQGVQPFTLSQKKKTGLPSAHTCFNRLELSMSYVDKNTLRKDLLAAISEYQGFGLE